MTTESAEESVFDRETTSASLLHIVPFSSKNKEMLGMNITIILAMNRPNQSDFQKALCKINEDHLSCSLHYNVKN